jgi:hypothetical protein
VPPVARTGNPKGIFGFGGVPVCERLGGRVKAVPLRLEANRDMFRFYEKLERGERRAMPSPAREAYAGLPKYPPAAAVWQLDVCCGAQLTPEAYAALPIYPRDAAVWQLDVRCGLHRLVLLQSHFVHTSYYEVRVGSRGG